MTQRIKYWSVLPDSNVKYVVPMTPKASIEQIAAMQSRPQYLSSYYRDAPGGEGEAAGGESPPQEPPPQPPQEPPAQDPPVKSDFMNSQGIMFLMLAIVIIIFLVMKTVHEDFRLLEYRR